MQPMRLERVHAARLLRTVAAAHANSGLDEAHPIELDIAEDALNAVVLGDERLLTRAVENAISNARLHNEQGCTISVELALRDGAYCTIRVSDDGAGIAAAGSFNRDHGLGLVLVDRIARAHEGSLSLDGAPGEGFSVTLALPLA